MECSSVPPQIARESAAGGVCFAAGRPSKRRAGGQNGLACTVAGIGRPTSHARCESPRRACARRRGMDGRRRGMDGRRRGRFRPGGCFRPRVGWRPGDWVFDGLADLFHRCGKSHHGADHRFSHFRPDHHHSDRGVRDAPAGLRHGAFQGGRQSGAQQDHAQSPARSAVDHHPGPDPRGDRGAVLPALVLPGCGAGTRNDPACDRQPVVLDLRVSRQWRLHLRCGHAAGRRARRRHASPVGDRQPRRAARGHQHPHRDHRR